MVNIGLLRHLVPLASLLPTDRAVLAKHCVLGNYAAGQIIFGRGEVAHTVPWVLSGSVELFDGQSSRVVRGETDEALNPLAQGPRRATTATCVTAAQVLLLKREQLDMMLTWSQTGGVEVVDLRNQTPDEEGESQDWMTTLLQNPAFHRIPPGNIAQLFACMQSVTYPAGKIILRQGNVGDAYFVVTEGRVQILRENAAAAEIKEISQLGVGRGFGEESLLSGQPRNATVRALTDVQLMRIGAQDFERLLKAPVLKEVSTEEMNGATQVIDVRLPEEFSQGHLPGAVNLPLARIRDLAVQLDPAVPCAVYCDSGARSASATFLLCERGFDARVVAGGIDASLLTAKV